MVTDRETTALRKSVKSEVVAAFYEAYNGHRPDAAAALYAVEGGHQDHATGASATGRGEIARSLQGFLQAIPDAHWAIEECHETLTCVAVVYRLTGSLEKPLGGLPAHGQPVDLRGIHLFDLKDEMLLSSRDLWNLSDFMRQVSV